MRCQHIVKSYGHHKGKDMIYIVMEFCNQGELLTHMVSQPGKVCILLILTLDSEI